MVQEAEGEQDQGELLNPVCAANFRSCVCTLPYAGQDRADCQHAIKELSRELQWPSEKSEQRLKRLLRYLHCTRSYGIFFPSDGDQEAVGATQIGQHAKRQETLQVQGF